MRATDRRLQRLERRLHATLALDPATICCAAPALYEYGPDVAPPPAMDPREAALFRAYHEALELSEPDRQFGPPP
jgi:hypothetical protein